MENSIKILSEAGYEHPIYKRTIYISSEKQKEFFRYHISILKKNSTKYNKIDFGPNKENSTVDMLIIKDGKPDRMVYITYYNFNTAKEMFKYSYKFKCGVFMFHYENV